MCMTMVCLFLGSNVLMRGARARYDRMWSIGVQCTDVDDFKFVGLERLDCGRFARQVCGRFTT